MNPRTTTIRRIRRPDEGSATIWAAALAGLLSAGAFAALTFGAAVFARHEAGSAADLAALAAAVHVDADDGRAPCDWADAVARHQRSRLLECHCADAVCEVRAAVDTPWGTAAVTARAGPARQVEGLGAVSRTKNG
jgi:secretion/DNA translocation related TadE-like protein